MDLKYLEKSIEPYNPLKDTNTIIVETNKIFHKLDAKNYDNKHPEIFGQLPPIYKEMCKLLPNNKKLKILDFGCGTGFEATQLLNNLENIEILYCYDISDEMLGICKRKINNFKIMFINSIDKIPNDIKFDVLITNSLLHHLPQPLETIHKLNKFLYNDCFYIMGHEPSVRYYKNGDIQKMYELNSKKERITAMKILKEMRKTDPENFRKNLFHNVVDENDPYKLTAIETVAKGLFELIPSIGIIDKIVDCYVPHSSLTANAGIGFDFKDIELYGEWELVYSKTYNFLNNNIYYDKLSEEDKNRYRNLEEKYPDDGVSFCCVWKKR